MVPIYQRGAGGDLGYSIDEFVDKFASICKEHLQTKRAKAFAFIIYDFESQAVRKTLENHDVFVRLDRLSGRDLSVFYLADPNHPYVPEFNAGFLRLLGVSEEAESPCVVFFRMKHAQVADTIVAQLHSENLLTSFHELYGVVEAYRDKAREPAKLEFVKLIRAGKFIGVEAFRAMLRKGLDGSWDLPLLS